MTDQTLRAMLSGAPFNLDQVAIDWVAATHASLSDAEKIGQLFVISSMGFDPTEADRLRDFAPAGITRFFFGDKATEAGFIDQLRCEAKVPLLFSADLEGSRMSLPFGAEAPNPLALAAIDDVDATHEVSTIMAREAAALGMNWSFTPVIDINHAFRSSIVATRSFGADVARVQRHALAAIDAFQAQGIAATVKHWPGEGFDDRDQHLVTTINPLSLAEWEASFGTLYRAAVDAGVKSVMSAHIALPAFVREMMADAGVEAFRPASVSRYLNIDLLRGRLGFNGVIVSDATMMAGFGAWGPRAQMIPEVIENGCDIILFSDDPVEDAGFVAAALADGRLSRARLDEALFRSLGLKASLGLHKGVPAQQLDLIGTAADRIRAAEITRRAPTLVKDVQGLLPLSVEKHRRIYVYTTGVVSPMHTAGGPLALVDMLRAEGFEVTVHDRDNAQMNPWKGYDLVLYLMAEETLLSRERIFMNWAGLAGQFLRAMERPWHDVPTALISFGYPYYLYDAPRMPCVINAYATMDTMQQAVLDGLMGRAPFTGTSPVDPFCGLPDAPF
ncbi:glycoside hydrolase family 3 protein [Ketogulonicigenium vulgare]|uniref:beta-N-acetylhexosaminidase n=1 Tax=Ketogulonicigenium vulgare (strain WSH-001) TaxID=759362 RepID=F9Y783_KETVW|nr:glycoside hydrolase family 3 N-terminal domain-containing protein [Ketogulonicigenium vulgare]ADO41609.1 putative glycosyl hydrolase [Ketogulonicigenium vulgare Y25]AEM39850.1 Glycoside hydrolase family 3 domain protein [Ketogulonicigenium vulgare WSH-001]ALJ80065.1 glycoside hydrolase family 3 [Ketogulonicigenium vulgare]ANW32943.1 glycoside hydrolase family 3 [Ketogulonicigenium vulgare]AOZ53539.1 glycosyl hydrolase [Ketogulonicigenium vulgare]